MHSPPPDFTRKTTDLFGQTGIQWLERLPRLIADCEKRWSLKVLPPFPLSYNYVAPATRADGTEVVLKLGVPNPELLTEIASLRLFAGRGIVNLLDADPDQGILLLERIHPGTPLSSLTDDVQATSIAAQVMRQLWRPIASDHPFPTAAKWSAGLERMRRRFAGGTGPLPARLVEQAERVQAELLASSARPVLLHGDLHHDNILSAERSPWLALDPKGVVGEPAYEVGTLFFNPQPQIFSAPNLKQILARRVDQLANELGFDRQRLVGWGLARAVLSAWWSIEDHEHGWEPTIRVAGYLAELSR
jgi:streptomycin 6-kinase